jgi:hypothetical protein
MSMAGSSSQGGKREDRPETEDKREKKKLFMKCGISGCPRSARKYCKAVSACQDCNKYLSGQE